MQKGAAAGWNYPVNPFELQKQLEHGIEHHKAGRSEEAERVYRAVLAKVPNQPDALNLLGVLAMEAGNHDAAFDFLERAVMARPKDPAVLNNYGNALSLVRRFEDAITHLERALAIKPDMADAWLNLGRTLNFAGRGERALKCFDHLTKVKPDSHAAKSGISRAYLGLGRTAEAEQAARDLIAAAPQMSSGYVNLSNAHKFTPDEPEIALVEDMIAAKDTNAKELRGLYFAAAKMCDDVGRYDDAFRFYDLANKAAGGKYDGKLLEQSYADLKKTYTRKFFDERKSQGLDSERPVFIVGMPRSGTTLTEQILASHPAIFGAGELQGMPDIARGMRPDYPQRIAQLGREEISALASGYLKSMEALAPADALRITDKLPVNFTHLGVIATLFPKARVIHCRRDPLDSGLSCFIELFRLARDFTTDVESIGKYYLQYERLMAHWRKVLPLPLYEQRYEELIADQEAGSRALVAHCDLPWDDACLNYQGADRTVMTPSRWQVRQPIYSSSVGRWRNYERQLEPLRRLLEERGFRYSDPP